MKKICYFCFILSVFTSGISQNQSKNPYVSELFRSISSKTVQLDVDSKAIFNIYTTCDSALFVVNRKGFDNQTCNGYAKISKINVFFGTEDTCFVAPPTTFIENGGKITRIWIWALAASNSMLFLAVDEGIWIYQLTDIKQYEYVTTIPLKDVRHFEVVNNDLHTFIENTEGFDWYRINLSDYQMVNIGQLKLKNPFFLQIAPAKIISIQNNALYLLQQSEPSIEKYSLTGNLMANYPLKIHNWMPIPNEITQKLDSIEDITERNYAFATYSIFNYNLMQHFYVFSSERFFMIAIDKKIEDETYITPYFIQIIGDTTVVESLSVKLCENEKFGENFFPFLTACAEGNLVFAQLKEYIIQLNRTTTTSWQSKTQKEYNQEVNLFHRYNDPIKKVETYHFYKNHIPINSIRFLDYDDNVFSLNNIEKEKAIFIVSKYPQCSACIKTLWIYFSNVTSPDIDLFNVALDCPTYLLKKENIKEVNTYFKTKYTPLYVDVKQLDSVTKCLIEQKSSPIVILFDNKLQHIEVYSSRNIFNDYFGNLNPLFIQAINNFVGK